MVSLRIFHRKSIEEADPTLPVLAETFVATIPQRTAADNEARKEKGIDIDMIDAEEVMHELQALAHYDVPQWRIEGEPPNVQTIILPPRHCVRPWAIATITLLCKVWPTIWMSPYEADTTKLRIRTAFHAIRKSMSYQERQQFNVILMAVRNLCIARCEDMKDGHKALLMKVKREELGVHMTQGEPGAK